MDKVVLITGAAGGLGRALTDKYLSEEWRVIATDIDIAELQNLPARKKLWTLPMDVTSDDSVLQAFAEVEKEKIKIDLIINNAGIDCYFLLSESPVSEFIRIFGVNAFGGYRVNQVFLPLLKKPGGRIIHISSESLNLTMPFMPYPLSKKLVEGYAKGLRQELRHHGIDVVIVRPGAIDTGLLKTISELSIRLECKAETDPLQMAFQSFASQASKEIGIVISPEKAAAFIFRVSNTRRPSAVYRINNMVQLRIAAMLPFWLTELLVRKRLAMKNP